ncbi:exo-beta-N-acetylmuramidase NamZ family protein [Niameybacter massiliensis]|uniref:exo-beta-N-acetylmuramidase NamZ family protein n=1 Tax=Niameybacter massiliensis TaxID=1658108 RepID=UPI000B21D74E|nr:DUF1343 domain-containing protein [Niameybacter massiliensis]
MQVILGIDRIDEMIHLFQGKRVGLITNPTGVNSTLRSTIDILNEKINLVALYSPEHGIRGDIQAGEKVDSYIDEKSGVKVYTLYGQSKKPTKEMLDDIDIMAIDIQDVGSRLYTYLYTMAYCMQSCREYDKQFVVFDRPNPVGGEIVEGGLIQEGFTSFVGLYPIPYRYGLTIGEAAKFFNSKFNINCKLEVIKMLGWQRNMSYEDTGLTWILPSPNMPTVDTAFVYNATCIFEGTNISEGRGTTKPFEWVGAPWLDAYKLAEDMNAKVLPGVIFRPVYFTPTFSKHNGVLCRGVQIHVQDRLAFKPVKVALHLLYEIQHQVPDQFEFLSSYTTNGKPMIDYNTGSDYIRTHEFSPEEVYSRWEKEAIKFKRIKMTYHLY